MNSLNICILLNIGAVLGKCPDDEVTQPLPIQQTHTHYPKPSATRLNLRTEQPYESFPNTRYSYTNVIQHSSQQYKETSAYPYPKETSANPYPKETSVDPYPKETSVDLYLKFTSTMEPSTTHTMQATPTPLISANTPNTSVNAPPECLVLEDCKAWYDLGVKYNGIYTINPDNEEPFKVYCDMETDGGGWTVFQRRIDGSVDFYRGWSDYEQGFGNLTGEFWLGLTKMHRLTSSGNSKQLRIDLEDFANNYRYAKYSYFAIGNSTTKYTLLKNGYFGDAGDGLGGHNGMKFSTKDQDSDTYSTGNCAVEYTGAWWYNHCHTSNLNGRYHSYTEFAKYGQGVVWYTWKKDWHYSFPFTEMKLK